MRLLAVLALAGLLSSGCATIEGMSRETRTGAAVGAVAGGVLGALIDSGRPWRGAVIGAAAGAVAGGWIGHTMTPAGEGTVARADEDVVTRAAAEAAQANATVKYSRVTEQGISEDVVAEPGEVTDGLMTVTVRYYRNNRLISSETRRVQV